MTQEEWDACSDEKRTLYTFLWSQSEISGRSGKAMREAILDLVADMPPELRVLPVRRHSLDDIVRNYPALRDGPPAEQQKGGE